MKLNSPTGARQKAFSLLEVMVAAAIFFLGVFSILGLVSSSLGNARRLQYATVDAGMIAAQLSITNQLVEGDYSGNLADLLGKDYAMYNWTTHVAEERTNKLFSVDIKVINANAHQEDIVSEVHLLLFRPLSPAGSLDGGNFVKR